MESKSFKIDNIPAILWGETSSKIYIYVHGKSGEKEEAEMFSEIAAKKGYQVLSFDLPQHGERTDMDYLFNPWNGVHDLNIIAGFASKQWQGISLYASSMGAYFSLLAYQDFSIQKTLFLSPILNMERLIQNMMGWFNVDDKLLREKGTINTPIGETLDWNYYCYSKEHPINRWNIPTSILYGTEDNMTERVVIDEFTKKFGSKLTILQDGEHYFYSEEQLIFWREWVEFNV